MATKVSRKALAVALLVLAVTACGGSEATATSNKPQTNVTVITTSNNYGDYDYRELKINGRHCITMTYEYKGYVSITCDWGQK